MLLPSSTNLCPLPPPPTPNPHNKHTHMHTSTPGTTQPCVRAHARCVLPAFVLFVVHGASKLARTRRARARPTCVLLGPVLTHLATKRARGPCRRGLRWRPSRPLALALFRLLRRRSRSYSTGNRHRAGTPSIWTRRRRRWQIGRQEGDQRNGRGRSNSPRRDGGGGGGGGGRRNRRETVARPGRRAGGSGGGNGVSVSRSVSRSLSNSRSRSFDRRGRNRSRSRSAPRRGANSSAAGGPATDASAAASGGSGADSNGAASARCSVLAEMRSERSDGGASKAASSAPTGAQKEYGGGRRAPRRASGLSPRSRSHSRRRSRSPLAARRDGRGSGAGHAAGGA